MESMIELICGTETEFSAPVVVGLIVFCLVLESIGSIAYAITSVGRR